MQAWERVCSALMNAMHTIVRAFRGEVWIGRVAGESMLPTLGPGDLVVCEQISGRTGGVTRGMIVVLRGADPGVVSP